MRESHADKNGNTVVNTARNLFICFALFEFRKKVVD
jgi:hypothetical protein